MIDVHECREHAERCMIQAAQTIEDRLTETAQGWLRLAADLAKYPDPTEGIWHRHKRFA